MNIIAKVTEVTPTEQVTEKVKKRQLIVELAENPQYPQYPAFEAINDKCALLDNITPGQTVDISFNINGRPWTDKTGKKTHFTTLQLWKISVVGGNDPAF